MRIARAVVTAGAHRNPARPADISGERQGVGILSEGALSRWQARATQTKHTRCLERIHVGLASLMTGAAVHCPHATSQPAWAGEHCRRGSVDMSQFATAPG